MTNERKCPSCGRTMILQGHFMGEGWSNSERGCLFAPERLRKPGWWRMPRTFLVGKESGFLCLGCGMFWGWVDLANIRRQLEEELSSPEATELLNEWDEAARSLSLALHPVLVTAPTERGVITGNDEMGVTALAIPKTDQDVSLP